MEMGQLKMIKSKGGKDTIKEFGSKIVFHDYQILQEAPE